MSKKSKAQLVADLERERERANQAEIRCELLENPQEYDDLPPTRLLVLHALKSPDAILRTHALYCIECWNNANDIPLLEDIIANDSDAGIRSLAKIMRDDLAYLGGQRSRPFGVEAERAARVEATDQLAEMKKLLKKANARIALLEEGLTYG